MEVSKCISSSMFSKFPSAPSAKHWSHWFRIMDMNFECNLFRGPSSSTKGPFMIRLHCFSQGILAIQWFYKFHQEALKHPQKSSKVTIGLIGLIGPTTSLEDFGPFPPTVGPPGLSGEELVWKISSPWTTFPSLMACFFTGTVQGCSEKSPVSNDSGSVAWGVSYGMLYFLVHLWWPGNRVRCAALLVAWFLWENKKIEQRNGGSTKPFKAKSSGFKWRKKS